MLTYVEDAKIISSFRNKSKPYGKIQNRLSHGFIFRIKGDAKYVIDGKTVFVDEGKMIFLPQGSSYEYTILSDDSLYTSINFHASLECPEIKIYSVEHFHSINFIHQSFSEFFKFGCASDKYKCMSVFYDLLSFISDFEQLNDSESRTYALISPAVEYLKKNIYESSFKISKLHRMCGISDTYFRRIFTLRYDMSPKDYVMAQRLSLARTILEERDYNTIREVAMAVGYDDPLYFSKAFKKYYGFSPSAIIT